LAVILDTIAGLGGLPSNRLRSSICCAYPGRLGGRRSCLQAAGLAAQALLLLQLTTPVEAPLRLPGARHGLPPLPLLLLAGCTRPLLLPSCCDLPLLLPGCWPFPLLLVGCCTGPLLLPALGCSTLPLLLLLLGCLPRPLLLRVLHRGVFSPSPLGPTEAVPVLKQERRGLGPATPAAAAALASAFASTGLLVATRGVSLMLL
jgi:hypothetical protein